MKNWRTTIIGCIGAAWLAIEPIITTGEIDYKKLAMAAGVAAFSFLVKDAHVTGLPNETKQNEG